MRRVFLLGLVVTALPSALDAQSVDEQIARAVMAAPANLQADAAVITFDESGEIVVVREGSNGDANTTWLNAANARECNGSPLAFMRCWNYAQRSCRRNGSASKLSSALPEP